jgi:uncharacterized membrane protein YoaK (UPF0700 family)
MSTAAAVTPGRDAAAIDLRQPLTRSLLALTFATGMIDAVSYVGLGRVFAANMTLKAHSGLTLALAATAGVTLVALLGYVFATTRPS